jgi:hypothetical protein
MSYSEYMVDAARKQYFDGWAKENKYKILNASSNDRPSIRSYAEACGAICVPDPRGIEGKVIVVKLLV